MALIVKISKGINYLYFQAGKNSIYIGPQDDLSKAKPDNVIKALDYSLSRADHYLNSFDELLALLPKQTREQYVSKHTAGFKSRIKKYSDLSK